MNTTLVRCPWCKGKGSTDVDGVQVGCQECVGAGGFWMDTPNIFRLMHTGINVKEFDEQHEQDSDEQHEQDSDEP